MITRPQKSKILLIFIIVLLAANLAGLAYYFLSKPNHVKVDRNAERKNTMLVYLKNDVGFSDEQLTQYDTLMEQHRREMKPLFDQLKKEKENRLKFIAQNNFADSAITIAINKSGEQQQNIESKMLLYIKEVRNLCTESQRERFDTSIYKIFSRKSGDKKKPS
jgi:periplasmic protein CpxP/Spy